MNMTILKSEIQLCPCCMEEHEVKTVQIEEERSFKNVQVYYAATYQYCDADDDLYMNEQQMQENDIRMKDAYRAQEGLLTSEEICAIRAKYGISQKDLCLLLGWGGKTVTRYESHHVQDRAHDAILKKLNQDPEWFLSLLKEAQSALPESVYQKYFNRGVTLYEAEKDRYMHKAIEASYAKYHGAMLLHGNVSLSLEKVTDVIRYFASSKKVSGLYTVKLMKLLWYADALSYKKRGCAITGLVYEALPMGAVPVAYRSIIELQAVPCEEIERYDTSAYFFSLGAPAEYPSLSLEDQNILDAVIEKLGAMSQNDIVTKMHQEEAYFKTKPREAISFEYARSLRIE